MSASWAAVITAAVVALGSVAAVIWRGGRHEGKLDTVLERLADVAEDHEERIRDLEKSPRGQRRTVR